MLQHPPNEKATAQGIGQLLDETFRVYGRHFGLLLTLSLCIYLPYIVIAALLSGDLSHTFNQLSQLPQDEATKAFAQSAPAMLKAFAAFLLSQLIATPLLYGTVLHFLAKRRLEGADVSAMDSFRHALRRLLPVIGTNLLRGVLLLVVIGGGGAVLGVVGGLCAAFLTVAATSVLLTGLGIAYVAVIVWLVVKLLFALSSALEEGVAGWKPVKRSFLLVRGHFWQVLGYVLLLQIIINAVSFGCTLLFQLIPVPAVSTVLIDVARLLIFPFGLVAIALMYIDLRVRSTAERNTPDA